MQRGHGVEALSVRVVQHRVPAYAAIRFVTPELILPPGSEMSGCDYGSVTETYKVARARHPERLERARPGTGNLCRIVDISSDVIRPTVQGLFGQRGALHFWRQLA